MEKVLYIVFKILAIPKIGRILLKKTEFEVKRYLPFDSYGTGVRTASVFLKNSLIACSVFFLSFFLTAKGDLKYFIVSILLGIASYFNSFISWKRKQEIKILKQLTLFIGELRHAYYRREDVEEAFSESFDTAGEELKLHLGLIEEAFEHGGIPEAYKIALPGNYLLVLLSICQCTVRFGDKDMIFVSNLDELQKNIDSDLLKWDREDFVYHSLFSVMMFPILALPFMERWAVSQLPELFSFYHDYKGSLTRAVIMLFSFPIFLFYLKTKDTGKKEITPFLDYVTELPLIRKWLESIFEMRMVKDGTALKLLKTYFPGRSYLHFVLFRVFFFGFSFFFVSAWLFYWNFPNYYLLIGFILAIGCSFIPYLPLAVEGLFYESELEEEIGQVRLMMISLSNVAGITAADILLWVESFTTYLKASISECIDELSSDEEEAFYKLREKWRNSGFLIIVDDLIASDKIGIKEAFKDLLSRREYYLARRRQDGEFITRKKEAILNTFMYLPLMGAVFLYLILPFLYLSLTNLLDITRNLR